VRVALLQLASVELLERTAEEANAQGLRDYVEGMIRRLVKRPRTARMMFLMTSRRTVMMLHCWFCLRVYSMYFLTISWSLFWFCLILFEDVEVGWKRELIAF
jgi:hypothetical protein